MTKTLKTIFVSLFVAVATLLAGVFFVGCNINYGIIKLVVDQQQENITLFVGESEELIFNIENFQKGFDSTLDISQMSDNGISSVEIGTPQYFGSQIKVQISAVAGGHSTITARTLEGNKSCQVEVWVKEYAANIESDRSPLYVSNSTPFVPEAGMFAFSPVTATENEVSFYLVQTLSQPINENTCHLDALQRVGNTLSGLFSDGSGIPDPRTLTEFDTVRLTSDSQNASQQNIVFSLNGQDVAQNPSNVGKQFQILALYNHSVVLDNGNFGQPALGYDKIVSCLATVYVLPDLNISISGGYVKNVRDGNTTKKVISFEDVAKDINIVPNNNDMNQFIFKIVANGSQNFPVSSNFYCSQDNVVVDYLKSEDMQQIYDQTGLQNLADAQTIAQKNQQNATYISITQSSQQFSQLQLLIDIFYDLAKNVDDQSVSAREEFSVFTKIAPKEIAINGLTQSPKKIVLYNRYNDRNNANFGWTDLQIEVRSGLAAQPMYQSVTFLLQSNMQDNPNYQIPVVAKTADEKTIEFGRKYAADEIDLSKPIKIRGVSGAQAENLVLAVQVESDIAPQNETNQQIVENRVEVEIASGATTISNNQIADEIYLDVANKNVEFANFLYADHAFQGISCDFAGDDILLVNTHAENPCLQGIDANNQNGYFLNLSFSIKKEGTATYTFRLDNGVEKSIVVHVIKTLSAQNTYVQLSNSGNEAVTASSTQKSSPDAAFLDTLCLEIFNPTNYGGSRAGVAIMADGTAQLNAQNSAEGFENIVSVTSNGNIFFFNTKANGTTTVAFRISGKIVGSNFQQLDAELEVYVKISAYTLLSDFYLSNGSDRAISETVYYGSVRARENSATFGIVAREETARNFFQFELSQSALQKLESAADGDYISMGSTDVERTLVESAYNKNFVYYYATYGALNTILNTSTTVTIRSADGNEKQVNLLFNLGEYAGLMFWGGDDNGQFEVLDDDGQLVCTIIFSNVFNITPYGTLDLSSQTYTNTTSSDYTITLTAYILQRNLPKNYGVTIKSQPYQVVENISLASSQTDVYFSNKDFVGKNPTTAQLQKSLTKTLTVYTLPTQATFNDIRVQFEADPENPHTDMLDYSIDISRARMGIFGVTLSVARFHAENANQIMNITEKLSGKVYIYPLEWGTSYRAIDENLHPIVLNVQYLNGTKANPYLLENAADVKNIGSNETSLASHYQINSAIDMNSISNFTPIGILNNTVVGFSGSIVGTTAQASINNINVAYTAANKNFAAVLANEGFFGLFAKINSSAEIENISFSGRINANFESAASGLTRYVSVLGAQNFGKLTNVQVNIYESNILVGAQKMFFGTLAGVNFGEIVQDFSKYDGSTSAQYGWNFEGQPSKNLAYFEDFVRISASGGAMVYAGGIAGASGGKIERILPKNPSYKMFGYTGYSAYTLVSLAGSGTSSGQIMLGGVVGVATYYNASGSTGGYLPQSANFAAAGRNGSLKNLLVGGEVNALFATGFGGNFVGGIAGTVDTLGVAKYDILQNTARAFLRGGIVGGIVGADVYSNGYGASALANFENQNKIEAVDDGRNTLYAANIIKTQNSGLDLTNTNNASISNLEYAIGGNTLAAAGAGGTGATSARRVYAATTAFEAISYVHLSREKIAFAPSIDFAPTNTYFGDFLQVSISSNGGNAENALVTSVAIAKTYAPGNLEIQSITSQFKLYFKNQGAEDGAEDDAGLDVFYMHYFSLVSTLAGSLEGENQLEDVEKSLNYVSTNSALYPFQLSNQEITLVSKSSILKVDNYGNISLSGVGLVELELSSVLNIMQTRKIYIYVVNYFDTTVQTSMFYASPNSVQNSLQSGSSTFSVYGKSTATVYLVPPYNFLGTTATGQQFNISQNGILSYNNVAYRLAQNTEVFAQVEKQQSSNGFAFQVQNQQIIFFKNLENNDVVEEEFTLVPYFEVTIEVDDKTYTYFWQVEESAKLKLKVSYVDAASKISVLHTRQFISTNESFTDRIEIVSTNKKDMLFYQILDENGRLVQSKMPTPTLLQLLAQGGLDWQNWIENFDSDNDNLFQFKFSRDGTNANIIYFSCSVNKNSQLFEKRFEQNIYGTYTVTLYSTELFEGQARCSFEIVLGEATLGYVSVNNYSNFENTLTADHVIVPSMRGLLEFSLNPLDAVFDTFTISNAQQNFAAGAGEVSFMIAVATNSGIKIVPTPTFGRLDEGSFSFTHTGLLQLLKELEQQNQISGVLPYSGKIYISYYMSANGAMENMPIRFEVSITQRSNQAPYTMAVDLTTKLSSYARLDFVDKTPIGNTYFVARGLSYNLALSTFGFSQQQVQFEISSSNNVQLQDLGNGNFLLNILNLPIDYDNNEIGHYVTITTTATKVVDFVTISTTQQLNLCIMDFVLNYTYQDLVQQDIVRGMENGVIDVAVGNPFALEIDLDQFLEYDRQSPSITAQVNAFLQELAQNVQWTVHFKDTSTLLRAGQTLRQEQYYLIDGLTFTPLATYNHTSNIYHFSMNGFYTMQAGIYKVAQSDASANRLATQFTFDVHQQSTGESPIPVYNYADFVDMQPNQWYILMDNIVLPNHEAALLDENVQQFQPIVAQINGLDGNGKKIVFEGSYTFDGAQIGVFESTKENSVFKNITIEIDGYVIFNVAQDGYNVGLLTAENNGYISNACVQCANENSSVSVLGPSSESGGFVAGLVATNNGFITNSRSKAKILANANLAGLVGSNSGQIASSYFGGGNLKNSTTSALTAGLVVENGNNGQIFTSYASGTILSTNVLDVHCSLANDDISSGYRIAGFLYTNRGTVSDCYSNLCLCSTSALTAGFVFQNSGTVSKCFSTSVLASRQYSNYGFARENSVLVESTDGSGNTVYIPDGGVIEKCYYLSDAGERGNLEDDINISIETIPEDENTEIGVLSIEQMKNPENFVGFNISTGRNANGVWFLNTDPNNTANFNGTLFNTSRPELVAANIVATSNQVLDTTQQVTDENGVTYTKYSYIFSSDSPAQGSMYNPILIDSAEHFEDYIKTFSTGAGYNYQHFRLIADVDYNDFSQNSSLYKTKFMGYLEGNFMTISGISLISTESLVYAGLFAEVGGTVANSVGTIMNLNLAPKAVAFANANVVGAVAGKLEGGTLVNVAVLSGGQEDVVSGNNIVGGVVGFATGNYNINNISSQWGARARNVLQTAEFDAQSRNYNSYSYAGSLVGALSGNGTANNLGASEAVVVTGARAGALFGLIDERATAKNINVAVDENLLINARVYGGLVAGESKGTASAVQIFGKDSANFAFKNFSMVPYIPNAVGGFAGLVSGGKVDNIQMRQSILLSTESSSKAVQIVGGIAGMVTANAQFSNVYVKADLTGLCTVGGVVGQIGSQAGDVMFENINVDQCFVNVIGTKQSEVSTSGLVGSVGELSRIVLQSGSTQRLGEVLQRIQTLENLLESQDLPLETKKQYRSELSSLQQERALLLENERNNIDVDVNIGQYVYGTDIVVNVGAIVGKNASSFTHIVSDTNSTITSGRANAQNHPCFVEDLTIVDVQYQTSRAYVAMVEDEILGQMPQLVNEGQTQGDMSLYCIAIDHSTDLTTRSTFACDVSFRILSMFEITHKYTMNLTVFGTPTVLEG